MPHASNFAALMTVSGLSQGDVATLLDTHTALISDWCNGVETPPKSAMAWAYNHVSQMIVKSNALVEAFDALAAEHRMPTEVEIAISTDDYEARLNGFVNQGHELATIALAMARLPEDIVKLVPRGSTLGTAAAEKARKTHEDGNR